MTTVNRQVTSEANIDVFNSDVETSGGYLYALGHRLSAKMANDKFTAAILDAYDFKGSRVIDIGCGDGTYTKDLYRQGGCAEVCGVDPAQSAIDLAKKKHGGKGVSYHVCSAYDLEFADKQFDVAVFRGVVHHLDNPRKAIEEAVRVSHAVVINEPNGYNLVLKIIEKLSSYHRKHGERSYRAGTIDTWLKDAGARVEYRMWQNLVPMFAPDWFVRILKVMEPLFERLPVCSRLLCGIYVVRARCE